MGLQWNTIREMSPCLARDGIPLPFVSKSRTNPILVTRITGAETIHHVMWTMAIMGIELTNELREVSPQANVFFVDGVQGPDVAYIFARRNVLEQVLGLQDQPLELTAPGLNTGATKMVTIL